MIIILAVMDWTVLPFAIATAAATFAGGALGLRLSHSLPTLMALTGGVVVAVAAVQVVEARRARTTRLKTALLPAWVGVMSSVTVDPAAVPPPTVPEVTRALVEALRSSHR